MDATMKKEAAELRQQSAAGLREVRALAPELVEHAILAEIVWQLACTAGRGLKAATLRRLLQAPMDVVERALRILKANGDASQTAGRWKLSAPPYLHYEQAIHWQGVLWQKVLGKFAPELVGREEWGWDRVLRAILTEATQAG